MIESINIGKSFGDLVVLDSFSHKLKKGKITALVGPNGSGKTTLFNIIAGTLNQDKGSVYLENKNLSKLQNWQIANKGVSRTFQQLSYFQNLNLLDHLLLCFNDNEGLFFNLIMPSKNHGKIRKIKQALDFVGLTKPLNSMVSELSYGQKKLASIAMALLRNPEVMLLDEPVAGVNPILKNKIMQILINLKQNGKTIFLIEHDINFIKGVADEVIVLNKGNISASGNPEEVFENKEVIKEYIGG